MTNLFISFIQQSLGDLVQHFGLSTPVAVILVNSISSGATYIIYALYPYLIPLLVTAKGVIAIFGASLAVGW